MAKTVCPALRLGASISLSLWYPLLLPCRFGSKVISQSNQNKLFFVWTNSDQKVQADFFRPQDDRIGASEVVHTTKAGAVIQGSPNCRAAAVTKASILKQRRKGLTMGDRDLTNCKRTDPISWNTLPLAEYISRGVFRYA